MNRTISTKCTPILALAVLLAGAGSLAGSSAQAGECPAGMTMTDAQKPGPSAHSQVTDTVISLINLAEEAPRLKDSKLRLRRLVIQPGGVVAWHSHGERPAIIYIVSGQIAEFRSTCKVPITHKAGESTAEVHTTSHWWKNMTKRPVVLLSADILHEKADPRTM